MSFFSIGPVNFRLFVKETFLPKHVPGNRIEKEIYK